MSSSTLAPPRWWLTKQIPQMRCISIGRLPERVALDELLETAELDDMQPGVDDVVVVVEVRR